MGCRVEDVARHALAHGRRDVELRESTGFRAQRVQKPLLRLVHREPALAVQHLDGLGLLPQQEDPIGAVERRFHLRRAVVVVGRLRRSAQRSAVLASAARGFLDHGGLHRIVGADVAQLLLQLVNKKYLPAIARQVHLAGDLMQQQDVHDRVQVGAALQLLVLNDNEIVAEIDVGAALEEAFVLPPFCIGVEHDREILDALVVDRAEFFERAGAKGIAQAGDGQILAVLAPQLEHHRRDRLVLDLLQRVLHRGHLRDARHEHVDVLVDVLDDGEGVEADVHIGLELDVGAARLAAELLEGATEVEHPDLGPDGAVGPRHFVHQDRLARTGGADDGEVVVAQVVVEQVQRHQLPAPAAEDQRGCARAAPLGDQRRKVDGVGHRLARDPAHLGQILVEALGQGHRQAGEQRLPVHVRIGVQGETAAAPDRVGRFMGRGSLLRPGEDGELVVHADQVPAGVDRIGSGRPVVELLLDVRHDVGHLRFGVLGCADMVRRHDLLGRVWVEDVNAQREQERCAVLQRRLHQVADQRAHLPQRKALGEGLDRIEARFEDFGTGFLPEVDAARVWILDGVEINDLVAQLAPVVVVEVGCVGAGQPIRVGEDRAPVDQVGRVAHAIGQRGRAQRGGHRVAQRQQLVTLAQVLRVARQRHREHQAEVADRVVKAGGERLLGAGQQVADPLAGKRPEQVLVARRAAPVLGLVELILVFDAQVGVAAKLRPDVRRRKQMDLHARARGAVGIKRDEHFGHAVIGARLRHQLQHEAHAIAIGEDALGVEVAHVGQPGSELLSRAVGRDAQPERQLQRAPSGVMAFHRGASGVLSVPSPGSKAEGRAMAGTASLRAALSFVVGALLAAGGGRKGV